MSNYVRNAASANEQVVYECRQHIAPLLARGIIALVILSFFVLSFNFYAILVGLILAVWMMARPVIAFFMTELGFTNRRLIGKVGLINTQTADSPLNKINDVIVMSDLLEKIFGCGTIHVATSSGGKYKFPSVAEPEEFKSKLMRQIEQYDEDRIKKQAVEMAGAIKESGQA